MGTVRHEHCWNNRTPPEEGFWAVDKPPPEPGRIIANLVWIPNRWANGAEKCGQHGNTLTVPQGCVGCTHLQSD